MCWSYKATIHPSLTVGVLFSIYVVIWYFSAPVPNFGFLPTNKITSAFRTVFTIIPAYFGQSTKVQLQTLSLIVLSCVGCRLGIDDRSLERFLARSGCEVHCFDPSLKLPHLQHAEMWLHRLSVDWRDPNPAIVAQRQYTNTKKLATILNDFGHRQVRHRECDLSINNF